MATPLPKTEKNAEWAIATLLSLLKAYLLPWCVCARARARVSACLATVTCLLCLLVPALHAGAGWSSAYSILLNFCGTSHLCAC
jgi:uncharacterized membrane protein YhdT